MATILNLKTNESVDMNTWSDNNAVILPALVSYWGASEVALSHEGMVTRGKMNSPEMVARICEVFRQPRELFVPLTQRPPVVNGQRLFAIKAASRA